MVQLRGRVKIQEVVLAMLSLDRPTVRDALESTEDFYSRLRNFIEQLDKVRWQSINWNEAHAVLQYKQQNVTSIDSEADVILDIKKNIRQKSKDIAPWSTEITDVYYQLRGLAADILQSEEQIQKENGVKDFETYKGQRKLLRPFFSYNQNNLLVHKDEKLKNLNVHERKETLKIVKARYKQTENELRLLKEKYFSGVTIATKDALFENKLDLMEGLQAQVLKWFILFII